MRPLLQFIFLMLLSNALFAQGLVVGTIKDSEGTPLPGATIEVKGTNTSAVADVDGQFSLKAKEKVPFTLVIRFVGYQTKELQVSTISEEPLAIVLVDDLQLEEVVVTSRRREETVQNVPIAISVVSGVRAADAGAFNVNRLKELMPSVQLYSSNPRNTSLSIRGLGTTFGLTNDGIDPGVGFYVDGVYFARAAATTLDFIDIEQIEVLRGPQGTLFGKNTTAGAFNVTTRKPSFMAGGNVELSYGNYGFLQAKTSITGPLSKTVAARLSFSGTQRDGLIYNKATQQHVNDLNNLGFRGQVLYVPSEKVAINISADVTRQRPNGYAQVIAGVVPTLRANYRQFDKIISDLNYTLPSRNAFDRVIDHDTPWRSNQDLGGISVNADIDVAGGTLTSTSAWRYWNWDPSNDRDFTGLQALAKSQASSKHEQWSQELRWAGNFSSKVSAVFGLFAFGQKLWADGAQIEEAGKDQWRFAQSSTSALWKTPGLFDGYGIKSYPSMKSFSAAVFGQIDWKITERLSVLPGIRVNYDDKKVDFNRVTYGGLQTTDPALLALKRSVYTDQTFQASIDDTNVSGQLTVAFKANELVKTFATYSTGFKPVGLNLGGLPTASGAVLTNLAVIKPERVNHVEFGVKTSPSKNSTLNLTLYNTSIRDYQTQVQAPDLAVNRGYLANAEQVRVRGLEVDGQVKLGKKLSFTGALSYTEGIYVKFKNAPQPLEGTGGETFKDISGGQLPGISKWATSLGSQFVQPGNFLGRKGEFFIGLDAYYRSSFSSSPSPSKYLNVDGYTILNGRLGFRTAGGFSLFLWGRNMLDKNYFEQLLPAGGNAGQYAGVLGDQRTVGVTLRQAF